MLRHVFVLFVSLAIVVNAGANDAKSFYGLTKVHELHLELTAKEWERMQKVSGGVGLFTPKKPVAKDGEEPFEWHKSPGFGLEFPWAHADLTADGRAYKNVGIRYKGNGSYVSSGNSLKRNFKMKSTTTSRSSVPTAARHR